MKVESGKFYFIKDEFFNIFKDYNLMQNKENGNKRPCYFCFRDKENQEIIWFVPISSKVEKYEKIYNNKIQNRKKVYNFVESSMTEAGKNARDSFSNGTYIYGKTGNPSTKKYYPRLYTSEEPETSTSLGLSDSPDKDNIYAAFTGTSFSKNGASDYASGYKQTQYYFSSSDLTSKKYYDDKTLDLLFSATGYGSGYWVASRCVNVYSRWAVFRVCSVHADGNLCPWDMFASNGYTTSGAIALRPVVSIPASKISAYVSQ